MEKTKLFQAVASMSEQQRAEFSEFLHSPFFNKRKDVVELWQGLEREYLAAEPDKQMTAEEEFQKIFPQESYQADQFAKLKSRLLNFYYSYLAHAHLREDEDQLLLLQIKEMNRQKEPNLLGARLRKAERMLDRRQAQDVRYYFQRMEIEIERNTFLHESTKRPDQTNLAAIASYLEHGFLGQALKLLYAMQNENKILGKNHSWQFLESIWEILSDLESSFPPLIRLYFHLNGLFKKDHAAHFSVLRELLHAHSAEISQDELRPIYTAALNHCARQMNLGEENFEGEFYIISKEMIIQGILLEEGGTLSPWLFKNINTVALRQGEFKWAEDFIDSHVQFVEEEHQEAAVAYNRGILFFFKGEFELAQQSFHQLLQIGTDIFYQLDARAILLRIYFAKGDSLGMESLLHSFRMYINRNKRISKTHKDNYLTFLKFFRRLINLPTQDADRIAKLRADVLDLDWNNSGKTWILEELDKMQSK